MLAGVRTLVRWGVAISIAVLAAFASMPSAHAQASMTVSAGFDGRYVPGARIPVRVTITADRLIRGNLEVEYPREGEVTVSMPIEVPGGSVKEYMLIVPTRMDGTAPSRVVLDQDRNRTTERIGDLAPLDDQEMVALAPALLAGGPLPAPAPLLAETGTARFTRLDEALLAQAPSSLESVTIIGLGAEDLQALGPGQRGALLRWVSLGGTLYVDAERPGPVPGLPDAWQPQDADRAQAGAGWVRLTGTAMADGRWSGLMEPTSRAARTPGSFGGEEIADFDGPVIRRGFGMGGIPFIEQSLPESIAHDSGLRAPRLGWLYGVLLGYVALVGPVTFYVLRRRRQAELAWVAVPLIAVLFTAASYAGGVGLRRQRMAHATIVVADPAGASALVSAGTSGGGGGSRIGFPRGWIAALSANRTSRSPTFTVGGDGPEASIELSPGEFAIAAASGPVDAGGGLKVESRSEDGRIKGTVRNDTPFGLEEVRVFVGKNWAGIGDLSPGSEKTFDLPAAPTSDHWVLPGQEAWNQGMALRQLQAPRMEQPEESVSYALWQTTTMLPWGEPLAPGRALAAGWTRDFTPDLRLGDREVQPEGRTLVLGHGSVDHASGPLDPLSSMREEVRGTQYLGPEPGWDEVDGTSGPLVARFTLPRPAQAGLILSAPFGLERLELWKDGSWQEVEIPRPERVLPPDAVPPRPGPEMFPQPDMPPDFMPQPDQGFGVDPSQPVDHALPEVEGRIVYLRLTQQTTGGPTHAGWAFDLREAR